MPWNSATNVGVGLSSKNDNENAGNISARSMIRSIKSIVRSPQFQDGVRLFAIGAAVSYSKMIFDTVLTALKRMFMGQALFRGRDEAFRWVLLLMMSQPSFRKTPRAVEVTARPSLLIDFQADYRGEVNDDEVRATWKNIELEAEDLDYVEKGKVVDAISTSFECETHSGLGVHFYPATGESVHFVFEGTHFWAHRERQLVGDESWDEVSGGDLIQAFD